ncbi:MAG: TCR/Tet family MFS transporter [Myxococcota bacterium]
MQAAEGTAAPRRAALIFIFFTVLLDMLAVGMIVPVLPKLVTDFMGGDAANGARMFGLFGSVWALMQFFFSPILGAVSDRFGRRPVILVSNFGLGLDYILMAMAPNLSWLFLGRVISGITAASVPTASAYIADVTPPEKRAGAFGMLGAAFGIGFVVGPAVGGLLGVVSPRLPFWVAAGLSLANACYGLFVLPESHHLDRRKAFSWKRANPVGALSLLRSHRELFGVASVNWLAYLAHEALPSTFVLYTSYRYGWDQRTVGLTLGAVGICSGIVQGGLVRKVVPRIGERKALLAGLFFAAASFIGMGLASSPLLFWLTIPLSALGGLAGPSAQGIMSRRVSASEQGQLQGANTSLRGISGLIGPGIFTATFAAFLPGQTEHFALPGAAFVLAGILVSLSIPLALWVTRSDEAVPAAVGAESQSS